MLMCYGGQLRWQLKASCPKNEHSTWLRECLLAAGFACTCSWLAKMPYSFCVAAQYHNVHVICYAYVLCLLCIKAAASLKTSFWPSSQGCYDLLVCVLAWCRAFVEKQEFSAVVRQYSSVL